MQKEEGTIIAIQLGALENKIIIKEQKRRNKNEN